MRNTLFKLLGSAIGSMRDLTPIVAVVLFFQLLVLKQPLPESGQLIIGLLFVVIIFGFQFAVIRKTPPNIGKIIGVVSYGELVLHGLCELIN